MRRLLLGIIMGLLWISLVQAATLKGTVYNENLEPEPKVLLEVNTVPTQKFLSRDGTYSFILPPGEYSLTAEKGDLFITEQMVVMGEGTFVFDLFLLPDLTEEAELLNETQENLFADIDDSSRTWAYVVAIIITIFLVWRIVQARKRYGSLPSIWKRRKKEVIEPEKKETIVKDKKEFIELEPSSLDEVLNILRKHEGRITQKELRKELMHLSEAKVSLIVTELEHLGKVEKIKKGRGNVLILKN